MYTADKALCCLVAQTNLTFCYSNGPYTARLLCPWEEYGIGCHFLLQKPLFTYRFQFSSVQALIQVQLFATLWTIACQASLAIINPQNLFKLMYIKWVTPSNHLILCCPHLFLSSIFPSIRVFSNESIFHVRLRKYWSFSFSISPSNEY